MRMLGAVALGVALLSTTIVAVSVKELGALLPTCAVGDMITTKNVTSTACGAPVRDKTKAVSYAGVIGFIIACIAFVLRIVARFKCLGGTFGMDDLTMGLTMVHTQDSRN
ncbi:integral membrane protein [Aspergillus luchuensis]|uniref:Integral membrane protein n=1 Tax=Aspergillus kawachii TaxID=1069201 RepID=A0A146FGR4_ASPKA|nr:integral membrane protein [Aspergillus luchuensis]